MERINMIDSIKKHKYHNKCGFFHVYEENVWYEEEKKTEPDWYFLINDGGKFYRTVLRYFVNDLLTIQGQKRHLRSKDFKIILISNTTWTTFESFKECREFAENRIPENKVNELFEKLDKWHH